MEHAQKPDFVFRRNGRIHLNRQGRQFSRILTAEVCASAVVTLDTPSSEVVNGTGYPLHLPVSPSLPLPCVIVCHHVSTGLYYNFLFNPILDWGKTWQETIMATYVIVSIYCRRNWGNRQKILTISKSYKIKNLVEINCQLDATDDFLLQILLLAQHISGTIMTIIRSSRVLYK